MVRDINSSQPGTFQRFKESIKKFLYSDYVKITRLGIGLPSANRTLFPSCQILIVIIGVIFLPKGTSFS
jgi:hypothetical protein